MDDPPRLVAMRKMMLALIGVGLCAGVSPPSHVFASDAFIFPRVTSLTIAVGLVNTSETSGPVSLEDVRSRVGGIVPKQIGDIVDDQGRPRYSAPISVIPKNQLDIGGPGTVMVIDCAIHDLPKDPLGHARPTLTCHVGFFLERDAIPSGPVEFWDMASALLSTDKADATQQLDIVLSRATASTKRILSEGLAREPL
jgi:hypothetical protein